MFGHQRSAKTGIMLGRSSQTAEVSMAQSGLADEKERSMPLEMLFIFLGMWLRFSRATSIGRGARAWSRLAPVGPSSELLELLDAMSKAASETRAMQPADLACAGAHGATHLGLGGQEGKPMLQSSPHSR